MNKMRFIFAFVLMLDFMCDYSYAQDWANLNRFKDTNMALGLLKPDEERVVFMGNSITEGWINTCPEFFADRLYINRGIAGQTTPQMLIRFRQDVINLKPKVVVILAGTNDIAENTGPSTLEMIMDNIKSMAELAKANGIKVILCSVLPVYDYPWNPGLNPVEKISSLNKMIQTYAEENGLLYLDYYSAMVDKRKGMKTEYSVDGVHPNLAGYEVMMPLCEEAIQKVMNSK